MWLVPIVAAVSFVIIGFVAERVGYRKGKAEGNDYGYKLGKEHATKATRAEIVAMGQKVAALFEKAGKP